VFESPPPAFVFDLDETLIDGVYQHVISWQAALREILCRPSNYADHSRVRAGHRRGVSNGRPCLTFGDDGE
jgi:hypothetical protein